MTKVATIAKLAGSFDSNLSSMFKRDYNSFLTPNLYDDMSMYICNAFYDNMKNDMTSCIDDLYQKKLMKIIDAMFITDDKDHIIIDIDKYDMTQYLENILNKIDPKISFVAKDEKYNKIIGKKDNTISSDNKVVKENNTPTTEANKNTEANKKCYEIPKSTNQPEKKKDTYPYMTFLTVIAPDKIAEIYTKNICLNIGEQFLSTEDKPCTNAYLKKKFTENFEKIIIDNSADVNNDIAKFLEDSIFEQLNPFFTTNRSPKKNTEKPPVTGGYLKSANTRFTKKKRKSMNKQIRKKRMTRKIMTGGGGDILTSVIPTDLSKINPSTMIPSIINPSNQPPKEPENKLPGPQSEFNSPEPPKKSEIPLPESVQKNSTPPELKTIIGEYTIKYDAKDNTKPEYINFIENSITTLQYILKDNFKTMIKNTIENQNMLNGIFTKLLSIKVNNILESKDGNNFSKSSISLKEIISNNKINNKINYCKKIKIVIDYYNLKVDLIHRNTHLIDKEKENEKESIKDKLYDILKIIYIEILSIQIEDKKGGGKTGAKPGAKPGAKNKTEKQEKKDSFEQGKTNALSSIPGNLAMPTIPAIPKLPPELKELENLKKSAVTLLTNFLNSEKTEIPDMKRVSSEQVDEKLLEVLKKNDASNKDLKEYIAKCMETIMGEYYIRLFMSISFTKIIEEYLNDENILKCTKNIIKDKLYNKISTQIDNIKDDDFVILFKYYIAKKKMYLPDDADEIKNDLIKEVNYFKTQEKEKKDKYKDEMIDLLKLIYETLLKIDETLLKIDDKINTRIENDDDFKGAIAIQELLQLDNQWNSIKTN